MLAIKRGGGVLTWPTRAENKRWGFLQGGYFAFSIFGVRLLQRIAEWGTASLGEQREFIARAELAVRRVTTAGFLHLELWNPHEARLFILDFKVWKGFSLFFAVNLGVRFTKAAQVVRQKKMEQEMLERMKREQAQRIQARRVAAQVARQRQGHPWPPRKR